MSVAEAVVRNANNPRLESDLAAWQDRWAERGYPGKPGVLTAYGIVGLSGATHAAGYVATRRLLPEGALRSGAIYGAAGSGAIWSATWALRLAVGETNPPTLHVRETVLSVIHGAALGRIVARA